MGWDYMLKRDLGSWVLLVLSPCVLIVALIYALSAVNIYREDKRSLREAEIPGIPKEIEEKSNG